MRLFRLTPLLALALPLAAQTPARVVTAEDYARAERFLAPNVNPLVSGIGVRPAWLDDGRFWYRTTAQGAATFWVVDPRRRTRTALLEPARLSSALAAASGGVADQSLAGVEVIEGGRAVVVPAGDRRFRCELARYACEAADAVPAARTVPANASVSPDGKRAVFIRDYNLWARDLATGAETQLTTDGVKDFGYATNNAGWVHSADPVVTWSPDSRKVATFQHDARGVKEYYTVSTNPGHPRLDAWPYPLPGDSAVFHIQRVIVTVEGTGPRVVRLKMEPDFHRSTVSDAVACDGNNVCDLQWYPDGSHIAFISSSRDHKHAWMRVADASTGDVRTLFEETSATQIGDASLTENLWRVLPASNELLWWSQRDDWTQLYLYDLTTGRLKNRVTSGAGNVMDVLRVDEKARTVWFMGQGFERGRDPYFQHLYKVGLDGKGQTLVTREDAHHAVTVSPDGRWFVDSYGTPDTPPVTVLRDRSGKVVQTLEKADVSRLVAAGWKPPTRIVMKARDGQTDLYGLMFTPTRLDSTKKYPVVDYIYPGPQTGSVGSRAFSPARSDHQALAELGFVVVAIDGMGTPGRSKKFADYYYGHMGDNTIPDQVAGIRDLARRYAFLDTTRVGIWGHSGGGFATASAMFKAPDFFKVGIAESGNHDNRNYEDDWGERYEGLLVRSGTTDSYAEEANQTYAANLKGKLFLAHGGMDDNVPVQNTLLVADALIKANKTFDLLIIPNAHHGYGADASYMMRRRWDYFVQNLLGAEPPKDYQIGGQRTVTP